MSTNTSLYLLPGMSAKLTAPKFYIGVGSRKLLDETGGYKDVTLTNGFAVYDSEVGEVKAVANEPAVIYTHKKFGTNKVYFYARTGEIGIVDITAVQIHDHSSIVTGGPAYATYFTDDETITD